MKKWHRTIGKLFLLAISLLRLKMTGTIWDLKRWF